MSRYTLLFTVLVLSLVVVGSAFAAPPPRAAYNYYGYNPRPRTSVRVQRFYSSPMESAPSVAAQPMERRAFSVEPQATEPASAARVAPVRRSFSYEPSPMMAAPAYRTYRTNTPKFLLPKTDAAKFR